MNVVLLMGRLTKDPQVFNNNTNNNNSTVARFTLAVDRRWVGKNNERGTDFISCVAFGKTAEFVEKYLKKATKISLRGRIQTGNHTNKDGVKVYDTDVVAEDIEFAESKGTQQNGNGQGYGNAPAPAGQGYPAPMNQGYPPQPMSAGPYPQNYNPAPQAAPAQHYGGYGNMPPQGYAPQPAAPAGYPQQNFAPAPPQAPGQPNDPLDGFMNLPDGLADPELPFA